MNSTLLPLEDFRKLLQKISRRIISDMTVSSRDFSSQSIEYCLNLAFTFTAMSAIEKETYFLDELNIDTEESYDINTSTQNFQILREGVLFEYVSAVTVVLEWCARRFASEVLPTSKNIAFVKIDELYDDMVGVDGNNHLDSSAEIVRYAECCSEVSN